MRAPIWVVSGRFLFDDEDTVLEVYAHNFDDAVDLWQAHMREEDPENENDLLLVATMGPYRNTTEESPGVKALVAQVNEAIAILETGTDYEKKHVLYILRTGIAALEAAQ